MMVDCFIKGGLKPAPRMNDVCISGTPTSNRVLTSPFATNRFATNQDYLPISIAKRDPISFVKSFIGNFR
jgi:hypothetical protein